MLFKHLQHFLATVDVFFFFSIHIGTFKIQKTSMEELMSWDLRGKFAIHYT